MNSDPRFGAPSSVTFGEFCYFAQFFEALDIEPSPRAFELAMAVAAGIRAKRLQIWPTLKITSAANGHVVELIERNFGFELFVEAEWEPEFAADLLVTAISCRRLVRMQALAERAALSLGSWSAVLEMRAGAFGDAQRQDRQEKVMEEHVLQSGRLFSQ